MNPSLRVVLSGPPGSPSCDCFFVSVSVAIGCWGKVHGKKRSQLATFRNIESQGLNPRPGSGLGFEISAKLTQWYDGV